MIVLGTGIKKLLNTETSECLVMLVMQVPVLHRIVCWDGFLFVLCVCFILTWRIFCFRSERLYVLIEQKRMVYPFTEVLFSTVSSESWKCHFLSSWTGTTDLVGSNLKTDILCQRSEPFLQHGDCIHRPGSSWTVPRYGETPWNHPPFSLTSWDLKGFYVLVFTKY